MSQNQDEVIAYYNTSESKRGYNLFLGGTKHFGYYRKGDHAWQINKALRQMEVVLAEKINMPAGARVLDAGCGVGDVAGFLAKHCGYHIEAIDILDFNIAEAKKRIRARNLEKLINLQLMSYEALAFPAASFDAIYTMETFVHASNPQKVLEGFYRVLKPGGKLIMFEYAHDDFSHMPKRAEKIFACINKHAAMPAFQQFTHGVQQGLMGKAGFTDIKVEDISDNVAPMMRLFNAVAYLPYKVVRLVGKQNRYINMMTACEFYRYGKYIKYNMYSAIKKS